MTIFTATQAVQAVTQHNNSLAQLTLDALITEFQYVFDQIQSASTSGSTSTTLTFSKLNYNRILTLLTSNGYTVSSLPNDGVASTNIIMQYPITIQWGVVQPAPVIIPAITAISPTSVSIPANTPINVKFVIQGGTSPFTWSLSGVLDPGLTFNTQTGVLSGTPISTSNEYNVTTLNVVDSLGQTFSQLINFTVTPSTTTAITPAVISSPVNTPITIKFACSSGTAPFRWAMTGKMYAGFVLNATTGVLTGSSPFVVNDQNLTTITATDANGLVISQNINVAFTPVVNDAVAIAQSNSKYYLALTVGL